MKRIILAIVMIATTYLSSEPISLVTEEYPPYEYQENGIARGMDVEIVEAICKNAGLTPTITFIPWTRCLIGVTTGSDDAIFSMVKTKEREKTLNYTTLPLFQATVRLFIKNNFDKKITTVSDLEGVNVGIVRGNIYGKEFDTNPKILKDIATDGVMLTNKLVGKRYNCFVANEEVGKYYIKRYKLEDVVMLPLEISKENYYLSFSLKSDYYDKFNESMKKLEASGELTKIRKNYKK